jgi:hypothetical protein
MEINFGYDEMKNFIIKNEKYKIVNVKCFSWIYPNPSNNWQYTEEEEFIEVAYQIGDIASEEWLCNGENKRKDSLMMWDVESAFYKEMKNKLLNL